MTAILLQIFCFLGQYDHITANKQAISTTLNSMPFLPPPTTNQPLCLWANRMPIMRTMIWKMLAGITRRPITSATLEAKVERVTNHASATLKGQPTELRNSPKSPTRPSVILTMECTLKTSATTIRTISRPRPARNEGVISQFCAIQRFRLI